jgi:hypothetical protein
MHSAAQHSLSPNTLRGAKPGYIDWAATPHHLGGAAATRSEAQVDGTQPLVAVRDGVQVSTYIAMRNGGTPQ